MCVWMWLTLLTCSRLATAAALTVRSYSKEAVIERQFGIEGKAREAADGTHENDYKIIHIYF